MLYNFFARFIDEIATDFSSTSEQLLASVDNILTSIEGVAASANEGASGTTDIANRASDVNAKSNEVMNEVLKSNDSADKLIEEISKFKI